MRQINCICPDSLNIIPNATPNASRVPVAKYIGKTCVDRTPDILFITSIGKVCAGAYNLGPLILHLPQLCGQAPLCTERVQVSNFGLREERLRHLKKAYGNSLLLAAVLTHNLNFFNMRLILVCGELWWSIQSAIAQFKKTAEQNMSHAVAFATGAGFKLLKKLWDRVVFDAEQLGRLGLQATEDTTPQFFGDEIDSSGLCHPGVEEETIIHRVMDFLGHQIEIYYWLFAWKEYSYPAGFAGFHHANPARRSRSFQKAKETWLEFRLIIYLQTRSQPRPSQLGGCI